MRWRWAVLVHWDPRSYALVFTKRTCALENCASKGCACGCPSSPSRCWPSCSNIPVKRLREVLDDSAETPRLIETLPRRGYRFIGSLAAKPGRIESLAVLPLENLSGDPEQEFFAEGMSEALI